MSTHARSFFRRFGTYSVGALTVLVGMLGLPVWLFTVVVIFAFLEGLFEGYSFFGGSLAFLVTVASVALSGIFVSLFVNLRIEWRELRKPTTAP